MTSAELEIYLQLTASIESHQRALDAAIKAKQELAFKLYQRYGRHAVYRIGEGEQQQDLMIARTKADTYYFAPRVRYPKESRMGKAEKKRLDRAARMQAWPTQASVTRPTIAEIEAAVERGKHDRARSTAQRAAQLAPFDNAKVHLPIVGDVDNPPAPIEPRLLDIQEPSGTLLDDKHSSDS